MKTNIFLLTSFLLITSIGFGQQKKNVIKEVYRQVEGQDLSLHIFEPEKKAKSNAAVVLIHGGGWNSGTPQAMYSQAKHLSNRGVVVFCPEYRVRKRDNTTIYEAVEDIQVAMTYVRNHAEEYNFDPNKIAVGGGSAGGHLAISLSFIEPLIKGTKMKDYEPNLLVLFNPVLDTSEKGYGYKKVKSELEARNIQWESFSPSKNIDKNTPDMLVMLGDKDKVIPIDIAKDFQKECESNKVECRLTVYEGAEHSFFNRGYGIKQGHQKGTINRWFFETMEEMDQFLVDHQYLEGTSGIITPEKAVYPVRIN